MMNIKDYNLVLAEHECAYTLWNYLFIIVPKYFPKYKIKDILKFVTVNFKEDRIFLGEDFLQMYNLKKKSKYYIKKYKFIYNIDYQFINNQYKFKQMILKDTNNIYNKYFIIIDKCMYYYMDYQNNCQKKINLIIKEIIDY